MASLRELERRLEAVERKSALRAADKAWGASFARRAALVVFIYIAAAAYFLAAGFPNPGLNALVPAAAFVLATLALASMKRIWLRGRKF